MSLCSRSNPQNSLTLPMGIDDRSTSLRRCHPLGWWGFGGFVGTLSLGGMLLSLASLVGCGRGSTPTPSTEPTQATASAGSTAFAPATGAGMVPGTNVEAAPMMSTAASSTKWIGGIPYDVFYDAPLTVASNAASLGPAATPGSGGPMAEAVASAGTATTPPQTGTPMTTTTPEPMGAGGAIDWNAVAPIEMVVEEVKQLRIRLTGHLGTVATYNKGKEDISQDANVLAAIAGVVEVHPGEVSWKEKAKFLRDLSYDMYMAADGTGSKPFNATQAPFEQIEVLLNGGSAPDKDSMEKVPFADVADRTQLMYRIRKTFDNLKSNINTEARLTSEADMVQREFAVLALIGQVISDKSYEYSESPEYRGFAKTFTDAAISGRQAAEAKNFTVYMEAIATIQKTCADCHGKFAFGDGGF
ncbi:MAG: hypothetical protein R3C01_15665 [Planctomycetaceae bacterium]